MPCCRALGLITDRGRGVCACYPPPRHANGPTTPDADAILFDQGTFVLPDILANAGGVIVSYFEWVQGLQEFFWSEAEVNAQLERVIDNAFRSVLHMAQERGVHMRTAAHLIAVQRVADAVTTRGIFP